MPKVKILLYLVGAIFVLLLVVGGFFCFYKNNSTLTFQDVIQKELPGGTYNMAGYVKEIKESSGGGCPKGALCSTPAPPHIIVGGEEPLNEDPYKPTNEVVFVVKDEEINKFQVNKKYKFRFQTQQTKQAGDSLYMMDTDLLSFQLIK